MKKNRDILLIIIFVLIGCRKEGNVKLIKNIEEFNVAVQSVKPGDIIQLANGTWKNVELLFEANGTKNKPIILKAQENGKVIIEGNSNLRISGENLIIKGLVFRNGHTPTNEVISFKKDNRVYAYNCRLTECVIDNFNIEERFEPDIWVALYGKNNRVDHCIFKDKRNQGVTLAIRLIDTLCQKNHHLIDHNYFGFRQNLGSNGGETIRLGTSHFSLSESLTTIKENYFYKCRGEHEIISNKSCGNNFINNTFYECWGTLTYRHGNDNISQGNFFFGNGKENTGGIRIINKRNKVINNYFYGLKGYRFRGALVIMNGIPNSPINRYVQVDGSEVSNNTFINCDNIEFCAGKDGERTLPPINTKVFNNIFYHEYKSKIFNVYDEISGIKFNNNYCSDNIKTIIGVNGIKPLKINWEVNNNIYTAKNILLNGIGCSSEKPIATLFNTGVLWYAAHNTDLLFDKGDTIKVKAGLNTLYEAIKNSDSGDIIFLIESGEYRVNKFINIDHPVTIKSAYMHAKPVLVTEKSKLFIIRNEGSLKLQGLKFDGRSTPDYSGNCIISTNKYFMNRNYKLIVENCDVVNLDINHSFDFVKIYENTFADSIVFNKCLFRNITGNILALDKQTEYKGKYNAEYIRYLNCIFQDVQGCALILLRNGTDESTFGPNLLIDHCVFSNVGNGKRNKLKASLFSYGVQVSNIRNSIFVDSTPLKFYFTNGDPVAKINYCDFFNTAKIIQNKSLCEMDNIFEVDPQFKLGELYINEMSKLKNRGSDGKDIGALSH